MIERDLLYLNEIVNAAETVALNPERAELYINVLWGLVYEIEAAGRDWISSFEPLIGRIDEITTLPSEARSTANGDVEAGATGIAQMARAQMDEIYQDPRFCCRVCGLRQSFLPWGEDGQTPSFEYCPCCGAVFGNEDTSPEEARAYRRQWLSNGAEWFELHKKPKSWDIESQLKQTPEEFA